MPTQYEPAYAKGRPRWPRHTVTDVMTAKDWQNFAKVLYDYIYYSQSQVSGSSPVAEVPGEKGCHPLSNASPTLGPGKVCCQLSEETGHHEPDCINDPSNQGARP